MSCIEKTWAIALALLTLPVGACAGQAQLVGSDGSSAGGPSSAGGGSNPGAAPLRALGEVCSWEVGDINSPGTGIDEIAINDHSPMCGSGFCVANHFQGLVSCPYGQAAGAGDCFMAGSNIAVSGAVKPQLVERQAAIASICSCQCAGEGPGPYCTCPESMQCEHLVDDLDFLGSTLGGSYCIPKGSAWDYRSPRTECVEPNCGVKHPY